jgi:NADH:ubiquinone oxidoreductase subunit 4 (subunit M)
MTQLPWLSFIIWIPFSLGSCFLFLNPAKNKSARHFGMGISLIISAISIVLWATGKTNDGAGAYAERLTWIPTLGVDYSLSMDGLSGLDGAIDRIDHAFCLRSFMENRSR